MQMSDLFPFLASYNQWANQRLYAAVATLSEDTISVERRSFFGSILATLNHIMVGDRLWMARFDGQQEFMALDTILYDDFPALWKAREVLDRKIINRVAAFEGAKLSLSLRYQNVAGESFSTPLSIVLMHFFNHQTHHRGQVHDMLSDTECPPPALDLIFFEREREHN